MSHMDLYLSLGSTYEGKHAVFVWVWFVSSYLVNLNLVEVTVEALTGHHWETSFSYGGVLRSQWNCLGIWASMLTRHIESLTLLIQTVPNGSTLKALGSLASSNLNSFLLHSLSRYLRQNPWSLLQFSLQSSLK